MTKHPPTTRPAPAKARKPRRMWVDYSKSDAGGRDVIICRAKKIPFSQHPSVLVIELSPESVGAMEDKIAGTVVREAYGCAIGRTFARAALAALGIKARK